MTLRLRLVLALVAPVTVASAVFLAATYSIYRGSQLRQLDTQLRAEEPVADQTLDVELARLGPDRRAAPLRRRAPGRRRCPARDRGWRRAASGQTKETAIGIAAAGGRVRASSPFAPEGG